MRIIHSLTVPLLLGMLAAPAVAQDSAAAPHHDSAAARYDALVAAYDAAVADHRARFGEVTSSDAYREARAAKDSERLTELRSAVAPIDYNSHGDAFAAAAADHAGQEDAVRFLVWIVKTGRSLPEHAPGALATLLRDHKDSAALAELVENAPYTLTSYAGLPGDAGAEALDVLVESPHQVVRMHALYARSLHLTRAVKSDAAKEQAAADLKTARELADGTLLAVRIDAPQFEAERLQIGMVAPDIVGEDLDGVEFRLSDYRGKVVVIDFWGDW